MAAVWVSGMLWGGLKGTWEDVGLVGDRSTLGWVGECCLGEGERVTGKWYEQGFIISWVI